VHLQRGAPGNHKLCVICLLWTVAEAELRFTHQNPFELYNLQLCHDTIANQWDARTKDACAGRPHRLPGPAAAPGGDAAAPHVPAHGLHRRRRLPAVPHAGAAPSRLCCRLLPCTGARRCSARSAAPLPARTSARLRGALHLSAVCAARAQRLEDEYGVEVRHQWGAARPAGPVWGRFRVTLPYPVTGTAWKSGTSGVPPGLPACLGGAGHAGSALPGFTLACGP